MNGFSPDPLLRERYWQGVRRRVRSLLVMWLLFVLELGLCWAAFWMTGSVALTILVAVVVGFAGQALDGKFDPLFDPSSNSVPRPSTPREKGLWLLLFGPLSIWLVDLVYSRIDTKLAGLDLFGVILGALLFGFVAGSTFKLFSLGWRSDRNPKEKL